MNDIGIIGLGTLGSAIARGLRRVLPRLRIFATTRTSALPHDVTRCASNADLAARTRTIVLCVKPVHVLAVLRELAPVLTRDHRVISTCAAVPLEVLAQVLPEHVRVARAMPNIACEFNEGVTALAFASGWTVSERGDVLELFGTLGDAVPLEQAHFDAVTALSGCVPPTSARSPKRWATPASKPGCRATSRAAWPCKRCLDRAYCCGAHRSIRR